MNSCELVTYVSTIACAISQCSSRDEMELLSAVFIQLGETLHTILTQEEICRKKECSNQV